MNEKVKILHLEDSDSDAQLIGRALQKSNLNFERIVVDTKNDFINALKNFSPDVIISDHSLPSFNSHDALVIYHNSGLKIPFILVTSTMSDEFAADIIKKGADDYILKDRLNRLSIAIKNSIEKFRLEREHHEFYNKTIKNEKYFRSVIENTADGIAILTAEGKPLYISPAIKNILGYTVEEGMQLELFKLAHPEDISMLLNVMNSALANPGIAITGNPLRMKHKNGDWKWIDGVLTNMLNDPDINGIVDNYRDVTEKLLADKVLKSSEEKYRSFFDNNMDGILLTVADGKILAANPAACRMFQMSEEEICKAGRFGLVDPSDELVQLAVKERKKFCKAKAEITLIRKDGTKFPAEVAPTIFKDSNGEERTSMILRDLTESKKTQEAISELQSNLQSIFDNTSEGFILTDANGIIKSYNKKAKIFVFNNIEAKINVGNSIFEFIHANRKENFKNIISKVLSGESINYDYSYETREGLKWFNFIFNPVFNSDKIEGVCITGADITQRKEIEVSLKQSEQKHRELALQLQAESMRLIKAQSIAKVGSWETDLQSFTIKWSDESFRIFDMLPGNYNLRYAEFLEMVHPQDRSKVDSSFLESINSRAAGKVEHRIITAAQNEKFILENWEIFCDEEGKPVRAMGTCQDITEQKSTEERTQQSEARFRQIVETAQEGIWLIDENNVTTFVNEKLCNILQYTSEEILGKEINYFIDEAGKKTAQKILGRKKNTIKGNIDVPFRTKAGTQIFTSIALNPVFDESGNYKGMLGMVSDITDKKKLQELFDKASKMAVIGSYEVDLIANTLYWSSITKQIHEVEESFIPDVTTAINFYKKGWSRQTITESLQKTIEQGIPFDVELQIITAKGNERWVRAIAEGEFVNGKCIKVSGSFQDIDKAKQAEIQILNAYKEKNIILESIGDAFIALDKNWIVTYWNKHAEKLLLKKREEMINRNLWQVFSDAVDTSFYTYYHKALAENKVQHFEAYYQSLEAWYEVSAYPANNGLSVYFKDITKRKVSDLQVKHLNNELQKHIKDLATSNKELEDFAYVASHDLQEPLRMVTGFLGQLEKKYSDIIDDRGKQYIHFAVDGAKRMRQIILDLLEFSRVGRGKEEEEAIDLNEIVQSVILLCQKQINETKAIITYEDLPLIKSYKTPLRQLFQNLVSNAIKYSKKEEIPLIKISAEENSTHWQFAIKDNGIGIEEEYFNKIFVIFQRLHNKDEYSGTGLGLAICKKIIDNLGGRIWLESTEGEGSTFYFTIPKTLKNNISDKSSFLAVEENLIQNETYTHFIS